MIGLGLCGGVAHADDQGPDAPRPTRPAGAPNIEEAKRHFTQGVALYNDANFGGALVEFQAAYEAHRNPALLYNIGLAEKALFHYVEAIDSLAKCIAEDRAMAAERRAELQQLIAEMRALLAEVTISVAPEGAAVALDGQPLGVSPLAPLRIAAGHHVIEVVADGHRPLRREVTVVAGMPLTVALSLEALPSTGRVRIESRTAGAEVKIDGQALGVAPVALDLAPGGHTLEVSAPGHDTHRSDVAVAVGQSRSIEISLDRTRGGGVYHTWWFWTVAVGVVAGIAAAIAIPLSLRVEDELLGTLAPGAAKVN
ncbi:MAG: PEGA domain-containing protein [Myxococcales bacterium]|nr:PEGA domain-containing protein [Myxococcales bacterium]